MKFEAVALDVGGVILQIDWNRPFEFAGIFDARRRAEIIQRFHGWAHFHKFERGEITPSRFFGGFNELFEVERNESFWTECWCRLIIGELEGAHAIFDTFKNRVPIYALSNTNAVHHRYQMRAFPILHRFDDFFASCELGARKPEAEIFFHVADACGCEPDRLLFVDDSPANVEAARRVGMTATVTENSPRATIEFLNRHL